MSVLRKTYLWDLLEPAATRILAMNLFLMRREPGRKTCTTRMTC